MRTKLLLSMFWLLLLLANSALADVPTKISYQGFLKDAVDNPAVGSFSVTFTIYDADVGGNSKWSETQVVSTTDGLFSVVLGTVNPILDSVFNNSDRYLGIKLETDPELTPRTLLTSNPYTFHAFNSDSTNAITDGGVDLADIGGNGAAVNQIIKWNGSSWVVAEDATGPSNGWDDTGNIVQLSTPTDSVVIGDVPQGARLTVDGTLQTYDNASLGPGVSALGSGSFAAGEANNAYGTNSTASGGKNNIANNPYSTVSGGYSNNVLADFGTVAGGAFNQSNDSGATVSGGGWNLARGYFATIAGGGGIVAVDSNLAGGDYSTVGGGKSNLASGESSTVPGGTNNSSRGRFSFAAGRFANAQHNGSFVWSDTSQTPFSSTKDNEFAINSQNGFRTEANNINYGGSITNNGDGDGLRIYGNVSKGINWASVYAVNSGTSPAIYAQSDVAGYFSGDVTVTGTLTKLGGSFKIDHPLDPENKYLQHSFVESPDMMNVYNGNIVTDDNGHAVVTLPDYFEALNRDFRYQLTVIGQFAQAIVAEKIRDNYFSIRTDKPNVEVSWQVTGIRHDAWANSHRIEVETEKPIEERGKFLHAKELGRALSEQIGAGKLNQIMNKN